MSVLGWLTNAHLVRKLHGSIYLSFTWLKLMIIDIAEFTPKELFFVFYYNMMVGDL